jgi:hypothetical protein
MTGGRSRMLKHVILTPHWTSLCGLSIVHVIVYMIV